GRPGVPSWATSAARPSAGLSQRGRRPAATSELDGAVGTVAPAVVAARYRHSRAQVETPSRSGFSSVQVPRTSPTVSRTTPVSSATSRCRQSTSLSPSSTPPPGSMRWPLSVSTNSTSPDASVTSPRTDTRCVRGASGARSPTVKSKVAATCGKGSGDGEEQADDGDGDALGADEQATHPPTELGLGGHPHRPIVPSLSTVVNATS